MTHAANVDRGREGVGLFSFRSPVLVICLLAWMATVGLDTHAVAQNSDADWPTYNRDLAGTRYSPLTDISPDTVSQLEEAWSYRFHPDDGFIEGPSPAELFQQVTPIVVDGIMYLAAGNRVVALQAETGEEIWRHELTDGLASFRGVAYWPGNEGSGARIFFTSLNKVIALNAETGERDLAFGTGGKATLRVPYNGVPVVYQDILVLGSNVFGPGQRHIAPHLNRPRGGGAPTYPYPRALDAGTGTLRWEFHTIPQESDFGTQTWGAESCTTSL